MSGTGGHSTVMFRVHHMKTAYVYGFFMKKSGTIHFDAADPGKSTIEVVLKQGSEVLAGPLRRAVVLHTEPPWFTELPPERRAPQPLPAGVRFGVNDLEYVNEADGSALVYCPPGTFLMGAPRELAAHGEDGKGAP